MRERNGRAGWLTGFGRDVKHAARSLSRSWTFTVVCVVSLALGLGINAAIAVFSRGTFAYPEAVQPDGVVELLTLERNVAEGSAWSYPDFEALERAQLGMDLTGWTVGPRHLRGEVGSDALSLTAMYVSANYFNMLRIVLPRGRGFVPEDDVPSAEPAAVLSHAFWRDHFNSDESILGRTIDLNGTHHRVIGIAPERFGHHFAEGGTQVWLPLWSHPVVGVGTAARADRAAESVQIIARLHDGVTLSAANAAVAGTMRTLAEQFPATNEHRGASVVRYTVQGEGLTGTLATAIFMSLSLMVLLVVCLNISGMIVVRGATKARELAIRLALGSSRARLVRYLMTESGLLALAGGLLGAGLCVATLEVIAWRTYSTIPAYVYTTAVLTCLGLAFLALFVIGLAPALRFTRPGLAGTMRDDAGVGSRSSGRVHRVAASVQIALALPMLVINLMILQSTSVLDRVDFGFENENLFVTYMDLSVEGYGIDEVDDFAHRARAAVAGLPGIESAAVADAVPLDQFNRGHPVTRAGEEQQYWVSATRAGEGYFESIGTALLRGRAFDARDVPTGEPVVVLTESLAQLMWPGSEALGQRVSFGFESASRIERTVVGIVEDVPGAGAGSDPYSVFVPFAQAPGTRVGIVARARSEDDAVATAIEDVILRVDPRLTRPYAQPTRALMDASKREMYVGTLFFGIISCLTLILAAIGVYGVIAFAVASRRREIGVRMALGASRSGVLQLVLRDGLRLALPGVIIGSVLAGVLGQILLAQWYNYMERSAVDALILAGAATFAVGVVLLASLMPARRAAAVQPMRVLRSD